MEVQLNPYLDNRFQSLISQLIDAEQYRSALFWSERYFSLDRENHPARHLYAISLFRCGQIQSALHHVNQKRCHDCTEIYAKCCSALGRYAQAKEALESIARGEGTACRPPEHRHDFTIPSSAPLYCRAGTAAFQGHQPKQAIANFKEALKLSPYLWEAFEGLCALGSFSLIDELFQPVLQNREYVAEGTTFIPPPEPKPLPAHMTSGIGFFTPDALQAANQTRRLGQKSQNIQLSSDLLGMSESSFFGNGVENSMLAHQIHPSRQGMPSNSRNLSSADESGPAPKKARNGVNAQQKVSQNDKGKQVNARGVPQKARLALHSTNLFSSAPQPSVKPVRSELATSATARRSTRLLSNGPRSTKEQTQLQKYSSRTRKGVPRSRTRSHASEDDDMISVDSALSPSASPMLSPMSDEGEADPSGKTAHDDTAEWQAADDCLLYLLRRHASAYQKMAQYECQEVVKEIESFNADLQKTPWAMSLVGRAYYEMVDYPKAEGAFKEVRRLDPFRLWDMDLYSTLLWHLKKNVRLSFLAQELVSIDSRSPQAWIAIGNCFSLQKERSKALSCFQRAAQLDPNCAYAYTLSGHESVEEDLEKAIEFFQNALRVDPRHYNAWYGLGTCYLRLSKLRQAEYHYRRATELHPTNAVLLGCLGMAVERRGLREEAFNLYKEAVRLAPDNALVRYRRAKILIMLQRYDAALEDLLHLRDLVPDESNVVYQLAKLYRLMGNTVQSALQLATARDLSPQSMSKIKKLVETTKEEDGENEEDGDMEEG